MVDYLKDNEKLLCRELWEEAFPEDSGEFLAYYFLEKIKDNRILAWKEDVNGQIDAMIHLNPYLLKVRNHLWKVDYLVAVATRKEKRHRGYMRQLLMRMMADMRREQVPFCFLMPASEAIYRPFGFTFIDKRSELVPGEKWGTKGQRRLSLEELREDRAALSETAAWMNQWLESHYEVYGVRDDGYVQRLLKEIASEDGTFDVFYDGNEIAGMRSLWGREKREQRLLYGDFPYVKEDGKPKKPVIMARIISLETFVKAIRLWNCDGERVISLHITDPLILENQGEWVWHLTRESSWLERVEKKAGEEVPRLILTVEELTSWLFGYEVPKVAESYAHLVESLHGVFLDEIV